MAKKKKRDAVERPAPPFGEIMETLEKWRVPEPRKDTPGRGIIDTSYGGDTGRALKNYFWWQALCYDTQHGKDLSKAMRKAILNGVSLPDDRESRSTIVDTLAGKYDRPRVKGRPPQDEREEKALDRWLAKQYGHWLEDFQRDKADACEWAGITDEEKPDSDKRVAALLEDLRGGDDGAVELLEKVIRDRRGRSPHKLALVATARTESERLGRRITARAVVEAIQQHRKAAKPHRKK